MLLVAASLTHTAAASDGREHLEQNWDSDQRHTFWFTPQGSQLIPYDWVFALERPSCVGAPVTSQYCSHLGRSKSDIASRFFDPDHMDRLRYIPVPANSDSNRAGLPIGFTEDDVCYSAPSEVDPHPEVRFAPDGDEVHQGIAGKWLGLNCAACHTAQIDYAGKQYLIEGAPAMGEFEALMDGLVMAMEQTLSDPKRYSRFASKVLEKYAEAASPGEHECVLVPEKSKDADALKADLGTIVEERKTWNSRNSGGSLTYGFGRLDAFNSILNEVR